MRLYILTVFTLAVVHISAKYTETAAFVQIVNPSSGFCLGRLGLTGDPFNAVSMQDCTDQSKTLWTFDTDSGAICSPNNYCLIDVVNNQSSTPLLAYPMDNAGGYVRPAAFVHNNKTLSIASKEMCGRAMNIMNPPFCPAGIKSCQVHMDPDINDCAKPVATNQQFAIVATSAR